MLRRHIQVRAAAPQGFGEGDLYPVYLGGMGGGASLRGGEEVQGRGSRGEGSPPCRNRTSVQDLKRRMPPLPE